MFKFNFFEGVGTQRRKFLAATTYAEISLHPTVKRQLELIDGDGLTPLPTTRRALWISCLNATAPLMVRTIIWNVILALGVVLGVLASRSILANADNLRIAFALAVVVFAAEMLKNIIGYFDSLRRAQVARGTQVHLFALVTKKLLTIDPEVSTHFSKGNLKTIISSDVEAIEDFIFAALTNWIPALVLLIVLLPVIASTTGWLGVLGIGIAFLQIPLTIILSYWNDRLQERAQQHQDSMTTLIGEWVRNIRLVRYLGWQAGINRDIAARLRLYLIKYSQRHIVNCLTWGVSTSWWMMPMIAMLAVAKYYSLPMSLSGFFASLWALHHLFTYIQYIPWCLAVWPSYGRSYARDQASQCSRLTAAPASRSYSCCRRSASASPPLRRFGCHRQTTILDKVSTTINLTKRTAIVGQVGSGKSILLELLIGERAPSSGEIEIEFASGMRGNLWATGIYDRFRSLIAYTPQLPFLSNASIQSNISLDQDGAAEDLAAAVTSAALDQDIKLFAHGMQEEVGETGINLSGGQKQRLSIARAFFSGRHILFLDDPLSAVDRQTEEKLADEFFNRASGLVFVSHRLGELHRCDRIIVLHNGSIVEDGAPNALLAKKDSEFIRFLNAADQIADVK